ncbi:hypothetical protein JCGZ_17094 [Jatropha curcas]|uniref:Uncharacterized protein n=1 Tax=Jatropha curcas TaxID=180498 RepID=A0A067KDN6_JATCU|nr:hypothetical protein JCGZ_17094 [Jatropha curcas]
MNVVAVYLLTMLGGNAAPSVDDIKDILSHVRADVDDVKIRYLLLEIEAVAPVGGAASTPAVAVEAKKEEKVEEKEELDDDIGFSLFK